MRKLIKNKEGYAAVVGTLIALLIVIAIGAMIFYQITGSFDTEDENATEVFESVNEMGSTIFGLLPIIALVVVAAIIIAVVVGMGGGKRGGM